MLGVINAQQAPTALHSVGRATNTLQAQADRHARNLVQLARRRHQAPRVGVPQNKNKNGMRQESFAVSLSSSRTLSALLASGQCVVMQTRIATNPRRANNKGLTRRMRRATPAQVMRTARSSSPRSTCAALPQAMASLATSGATGGMALESAGVAKKMRSGTSALETKTHIDNSAENNACLLDYTGCLGFRAANRSVFERLLTRAFQRWPGTRRAASPALMGNACSRMDHSYLLASNPCSMACLGCCKALRAAVGAMRADRPPTKLPAAPACPPVFSEKRSVHLLRASCLRATIALTPYTQVQPLFTAGWQISNKCRVGRRALKREDGP